jgi:hypothetical protein
MSYPRGVGAHALLAKDAAWALVLAAVPFHSGRPFLSVCDVAMALPPPP